MNISFKKCFLAATLCIIASLHAHAFIVLPEVITDNMVLQQKETNTLWGKGSAGKTITIITSWNKQTYKSTIDADGNWKVKIKTPEAGGPYNISLNDGELLTLKNIMIGEVWLCSGQSNMEMPLAGWGKIKDYQKEVANANFPQIRLLKVKKAISSRPLNDFKSNTMGWQECSPSTIADFSATAYFFARTLYQAKPVAIGLIDATWGGTIIESWTSRASIGQLPAFADSVKKIAALPADQKLQDPNKPTLLFNAMINPFLQVSIKGVLWYQGESNNRRAYQYRELFPLMIKDWRTKFNQPKLPFLFVQLAGYFPIEPQPAEGNWAELREAQAMALSLPNTGMAVAVDLGDEKDIHPKNKQEVGRRLALVAMAKVYNHDVIFSGPVYKGMNTEGNKMVLTFDKTIGGLKSANNEDIKGFAIAGADKKFYWAKAEVKGNRVVVYAPEVKNPVAVRYAWANNPVSNLTNGSGLPAVPFRTDDWPGLTFSAR
jgi:sialate O-acetylesterase